MTDPVYLASLAPLTELLPALLDNSLNGVLLLRPVYDAPTETGTEAPLVDMAYEYLNPAAQRMMGLPERPGTTMLTEFPDLGPGGFFNAYRDAFLGGEPVTFSSDYQDARVSNHYRVALRRIGEHLLVTFDDTSHHPRTAAETALRASQTRERAARADAERQRNQLQTLFAQAPVAIGLVEGPDCVVTLVNQQMSDLWGHPVADILNRPLLEGVPELRGQGFDELLVNAGRTGVPVVGKETPAQLLRDGVLETSYYNFVYQPLYADDETLIGVVNVAIDVTELVRARQLAEEQTQQVRRLADELSTASEDLQAASSVAEQARADAEARRQQLHALFMQAPAMICVFGGPLHVFELVNPPYQALVGDRPLLGKPIAQAMPELAGQPIFELLDSVYQTGEPFYANEMLVQLDHRNEGRTDLEKRYYNFTYQPRHNAQGAIDGILVFAYDVTVLVAARQRVEASEAALQITNEDLAAANEEMQAINEELQATNTELFSTQYELRHLNASLEDRVAERTRQLGASLSEAQQQRVQSQLHQTLLQQILGQVPASIASLHGPEHRFTFFNVSYQQLVGNRARLGATVAEALPEVVEQGFTALLDRVYQTGEPFVGTEVPADLLDTSGAPYRRYIDLVYQPLTDRTGRTQGILAFVLDVTERVQARRGLEEMGRELTETNTTLRASIADAQAANEQLTRVNVDLDTFIYTASHDLRAPIVNIDGLLNALEQDLPAAARQDAAVAPLLRMMHDAIARFQRTLDHLTDITKLQKTQDQPTTLVDLADLIGEVRLDLAPQIQEASATIAVELAACPRVSFAEKNLRSIVYNLLSNALKYRDPARPLRIEISCQPAAGFVVLAVADNGLGIPGHRHGDLFTMFQRLHAHVEGSGVGLYMVKKIVENAGGRVEVESEPGVGSTFQVYLRQQNVSAP